MLISWVLNTKKWKCDPIPSCFPTPSPSIFFSFLYSPHFGYTSKEHSYYRWSNLFKIYLISIITQITLLKFWYDNLHDPPVPCDFKPSTFATYFSDGSTINLGIVEKLFTVNLFNLVSFIFIYFNSLCHNIHVFLPVLKDSIYACVVCLFQIFWICRFNWKMTKYNAVSIFSTIDFNPWDLIVKNFGYLT